MTDPFYRAFEELHRGSRDLIKSRLRAYLPFIEPLSAHYQPAAALDLGCGRGEWLELLRETGFDACGVDLDQGMLDACHDLGLHAQQADALATLRARPDSSAVLVSAFHVVEHMPFDDVQTLIREALRVLMPGGLLILETPNPENLAVGASEFYKDPTHERPIPWELLRFSVGHAGFHRNVVVRLQEMASLRSPDSEVALINVLNGVSPDYAVVAQKEAASDVLARFDRAFQANYGVSLESLALRYDLQTERHFAEIRNIVARAGENAASDMQQMNQRLVHTEERLARLDAQLHAILSSSSWRITAPLRLVSGGVRRLISAIREGRIVSGTNRRVKGLLRAAALAVLRRPTLGRIALGALRRMPRLEARLRSMATASPKQFDAVSHKKSHPSQLSPRAQKIHAELKSIVDRKKN